MDNISQLRQQVIDLIEKELAYISGFFPHDLGQFFHPELLYFQAVFAFLKDRKGVPARAGGTNIQRRNGALLRLAAGIELLSIGLKIHDFDIDGLKGAKPCRSHAVSKEKTYTLELLFGDIFYSRAVIYLLDFGDHRVFDEILTSLKTVHQSRLAVHQCIMKSMLQKGPGLMGLISRRPPFFYGFGELFKTSFLIGMANGLPQEAMTKMGNYYKAISHMVVFKTYCDLERLFSLLCPGKKDQNGSPCFQEAKAAEKASIEGSLQAIQEPFFQENLRSIANMMR